MKKIKYISLAFVATLSFSTFSYAEIGEQRLLQCPSASVVMQNLNKAPARYFQGTSSFNIGMDVAYENDKTKVAAFTGTLITSPVSNYQMLNVTLAEASKVATYVEGQKYSYVSCRYKVLESKPAYTGSSTYQKLADMGLTSASDGYFNLESIVYDSNCSNTGKPNEVVCKVTK